MLDIHDIETGYGKKQVLYGFTMHVGAGEIVAIIGPNGAGKSTVLKAACGLLPVWNGTIHFEGRSISGTSPAQNVSYGVVYAPQGNRVFVELTVKENLEIGGISLSRHDLAGRVDQVLEQFPVLRKRIRQNAGKLSGGEQQMLALARALVLRPRLLMLDEPSLGLSPDLVRNIFDKILQLNKESGLSILIVEQKVNEVLKVCHRAYSLKVGRLAFEGSPEELTTDKEKLKELFL